MDMKIRYHDKMISFFYNRIVTIWKESRFSFSIILIFLFSLIILLFIFHSQISSSLYGVENEKATGEFITLCLSVIGGLAVLYGLYLNGKRIQEQTRQNNISEISSFDKRFGDAIGYLGNENVSIVLGGIYTLYQLTKENKRYIPVVSRLFINYLNADSSSLYKKSNEETIDEFKKQYSIPESVKIEEFLPFKKNLIIFQTIIDSLFDDERTFEGYISEINNADFNFTKFKNIIQDCTFNHCSFSHCTFEKGIFNCDFNGGKLHQCDISNANSAIAIKRTNFTAVSFDTINIINFEIINSHFAFDYIRYVQFVSKIKDSTFEYIFQEEESLDDIHKIHFKECEFENASVSTKHYILSDCINEPMVNN